MKGQCHKAVEFVQIEENSGDRATNSGESILTTGSDLLNFLCVNAYKEKAS